MHKWALLWSAELQGKAAMGGREDSILNAGDLLVPLRHLSEADYSTCRKPLLANADCGVGGL